jgi:outer membrane lipoprotein-sorting protein
LDYQAYEDGYARTLRVISQESHVDLTFKIVNLDPRPSLPATMFSIDVPTNAREISLGDL